MIFSCYTIYKPNSTEEAWMGMNLTDEYLLSILYEIGTPPEFPLTESPTCWLVRMLSVMVSVQTWVVVVAVAASGFIAACLNLEHEAWMIPLSYIQENSLSAQQQPNQSY